MESLNNCFSELQQQASAQGLELANAHHGYVETRREQVQFQEESVMKEKALRETQIRSIHEMGEMKRAQELRVSVQNFSENHETIQRLTSQVQEFQERMNYLNDLGECHEVESN